jgi:hypothetical protein
VVLEFMAMFINFDSMNPWLALSIIGPSMTVVWLVSLKVTGNRAWPYVYDYTFKYLYMKIAKHENNRADL